MSRTDELEKILEMKLQASLQIQKEINRLYADIRREREFEAQRSNEQTRAFQSYTYGINANEAPRAENVSVKRPVNDLKRSDAEDIPVVMPHGENTFRQENNKKGTEYFYGRQPRREQNRYGGNVKKEMPKKRSMTESFIGKNIMGIAASVLIFISLTLFATLIIPKVPDEVKLVLMFAVSFAVTAVGFAKWFPKKESNFFLILGACGMGMIYISLFLSHIWFGYLNAPALYLLLLVWTAGVLFLSRYRKMLFTVTGNIGITIAVIFGVVQSIRLPDRGLLLVIVAYLVVGALAFIIPMIKDDIAFIVNSVFCIVNTFILSAVYSERFSGGLSTERAASFVIPAVIFVFCAVMTVVCLTRKKKVGIPGVLTAALFSGAVLMNGRFLAVRLGNAGLSAVMLVLAVIIISAVEFCTRILSSPEAEARDVLYIWKSLLLAFAVTTSLVTPGLEKYASCAIFVLPLLVFGFVTRENFYKIAGLICWGVLLAASWVMEPVALHIWTIVIFASAIALLLIRREQYDINIKIASYVMFLIGLVMSVAMLAYSCKWDQEMTCAVMLLVLGLINCAVAHSFMSRDFNTRMEEEVIKHLTYGVNAILMVFALWLLNTVKGGTAHFTAVLGAVLVFLINSVSLLKTGDPKKSVYVGAKTTVLLLAILVSYHVPNYTLSAAAFALSIVLIVIGFRINVKELRFYGLAVSIVCVIKLVMVDIKYDNTAGRAVSFFVCGALCFAISAIYNVADKRLKTGEDLKGDNGAGIY